MKKIMAIALLGILFGLSIGWFIFSSSPETASTAPQNIKKIAYYQDPMHPWYTSAKPGKAPDCGMDLVPVYEGDDNAAGIKIDPVTVQNIGVKTEMIGQRKLNKTIRTNGKIDYDETGVYTVNSKIMGWVEKLHVDYSGQAVRKGQPLMDLYSPELLATQQELLQAIHYRAQLAGSADAEVIKGAEELVRSARRRLLYWDVPESEINALEQEGAPRKTLTINSPVKGVVIEKMVLTGQNIMPGMSLYKIADLSQLWVLADIYEYELPWIKVGQKAEIELSYLPGKTISGTVAYIYPYLNAETRTAQVRIQIRNTPDLQFKPEMFVTVKLVSPLSVDALVVPEEAVIRSGERNIVVIALGDGYFDPRDVKLGVTAEGYTQVLAGVHAGETVVTSAQFLIDSESNLKAAVSSMSAHAGMNMSAPLKEINNSSLQPVQIDTVNSKQKIMDHKHNVMSRSGMDSMQHMDMSGQQENDSSQVQGGEKQDKVIYTCVMHPQIRSDKPGTCPLCGMSLLPLPADSTRSGQNN